MLAFTAANANFESDPSPFATPWVQKENPFKYRELAQQWTSPAPKRHLIGLVGGNEVSVIAGNMADLESDLRGTTRPLTRGPELEHAPIPPNATQARIKIDTSNLNISGEITITLDA